MQMPTATLNTAKGCFSEQSPLFAGCYAGAASPPALRKVVEQSDCLVTIGYRRVDAVSGFFTDSMPADAIHLNGFSADIVSEHFEGITLRTLLQRVTGGLQRRENAPSFNRAAARKPVAPADHLTQARYWEIVQNFLRPGDIVIAEDGTSSAGGGELVLPEGCTFITQAIWGSIGYSVGCLLGTLLAAPRRRSVLLVGDGAFQLTAQEISTMLRHGLNARIFLINNGGYTIERTILGKSAKYNDIANWNYADLPRALSRREVRSHVIRSADELEAALSAPDDSFQFLEIVIAPDDAPAGLIKAGHASADLDYGPAGPQHRADAQIGVPAPGASR
jgi:indolepyruvate decarboxylase